LRIFDHILSFPKGGLPSLRHNDIRDFTASLLPEVSFQVIVEPELQPVSNPVEYSLATSNTQDGAHLGVTMNGFWDSQSEIFLLMSGVLILMRPPVSVLRSLLLTEVKISNALLMANGSGRWNMIYSTCFVSHWERVGS